MVYAGLEQISRESLENRKLDVETSPESSPVSQFVQCPATVRANACPLLANATVADRFTLITTSEAMKQQFGLIRCPWGRLLSENQKIPASEPTSRPATRRKRRGWFKLITNQNPKNMFVNKEGSDTCFHPTLIRLAFFQ
jgi:hypothetical protein